MHRVNYDDISHRYDEPIRDHKIDLNLLDFLASNPGLKEADVTILDVGCGTGRQLAANRKRFPRMGMVGADRFRGMLRVAGERCSTVGWVQADGASLPFGSASLHYATNQFSYQHIRNTERLLGELYRVLKPGGRFVMTNIDPWSMTDWIIYRYFPEAFGNGLPGLSANRTVRRPHGGHRVLRSPCDVHLFEQKGEATGVSSVRPRSPSCVAADGDSGRSL